MAAKARAAKPEATRRRGRPSKFDDAFYELATNYCLLGATNDQLADFFEVALSTFKLWMSKDSQFSAAVKKGRTDADALVAKSLYHRAIGYSHPKVHVSNYQGEITLTPLIEHYPPDTAAAFIWLKNRAPDRWRDKQPEGTAASPREIAEAVREELAKLEG